MKVLSLVKWGPLPHPVMALDDWSFDILPNLVEQQRSDPKREIAVGCDFLDRCFYGGNRAYNGKSRA